MKKIMLTLLLIVQLTISAEKSDNNMLLLPFNAFSYTADYHIIGFPENHKTIESIEAFIFKKNDGFIFRAIITDHNKRQTDYVNSELLINGYEMIKTVTEREVKLVDGLFEITNSKRDCKLQFYTDETNKIELHYWGHNNPDSKYGALTDPMGHSPDCGLPIILRSKSSIGKEKSYAVIDKKKYKIKRDTDTSEPPWFTAARIYLTEDYFFALLPAYETKEKIQYIPEGNIINNTLSYSTTNGIKKVYLDEKGDVKKIRYQSKHDYDKKSFLELSFDPYLPDIESIKSEKPIILDFSIKNNLSKKNDIFGQIHVHRRDQRIVMKLVPEYPDWAHKNRKMIYQIDLDSNMATINGIVDN